MDLSACAWPPARSALPAAALTNLLCRNAFGRLPNELGDCFWLRNVDCMASLYLHDAGSGPLGHKALRGGRDHPVIGRNEIAARLTLPGGLRDRPVERLHVILAWPSIDEITQLRAELAGLGGIQLPTLKPLFSPYIAVSDCVSATAMIRRRRRGFVARCNTGDDPLRRIHRSEIALQCRGRTLSPPALSRNQPGSTSPGKFRDAVG